jgi:hypothetical protein
MGVHQCRSGDKGTEIPLLFGVCVCVYVLVYVYEHVCLCVLTYCMCVHMFVRGHVSRAYVCTQTMQTCALLFHVCTAAVGTMSTFTHTVEGLWL